MCKHLKIYLVEGKYPKVNECILMWATHSSILAWKILWMEEPVRLQSMGSQRMSLCGVDYTGIHTCQSFSISALIEFYCI